MALLTLQFLCSCVSVVRRKIWCQASSLLPHSAFAASLPRQKRAWNNFLSYYVLVPTNLQMVICTVYLHGNVAEAGPPSLGPPGHHGAVGDS